MRAAVFGIVLFVSSTQLSAEWAKEPSGYRGVQFGATRAATMASLNNLNVCTVETGNGILACTDGRNSFRLGEVPIKERLFLPNDAFVQVTLEYSSDHYAFVKRGIPAVLLFTGYANGGRQAWDRFFKATYHSPRDDLSQPINWAAAARFAELNTRITRLLADDLQRPRWMRGDYFGERFAPGGRARAAEVDFGGRAP